MITVKELKEWLNTLPDEESVGIDDGGLILIAELGDAYLEVGGMPDDDIEGDGKFACTCGEEVEVEDRDEHIATCDGKPKP